MAGRPTGLVRRAVPAGLVGRGEDGRVFRARFSPSRRQAEGNSNVKKPDDAGGHLVGKRSSQGSAFIAKPVLLESRAGHAPRPSADRCRAR